jgi:hypothetical protein
MDQSADLGVSATAAVNNAVVLTLPAVSNRFHHIVSIQITKLYTAKGTASGAGNIITSTNLPGNPSWRTEQAAQEPGVCVPVLDLVPSSPIRSLAMGTPTTITCPAQAQTIWTINVRYFANL